MTDAKFMSETPVDHVVLVFAGFSFNYHFLSPILNFAKKIGYLSAMSVHYAFMKKFVAI